MVDLLAKQSAARLREMEAQLRSQMDDLRVQAEWVARALVVKGQTTADAPPSTGHKPVPSPSGGVNAVVRRRRSNKRGAIRALMETRPDHTWLPSEVRDGLATQGIETTADSLRVAMRRMAEEGLLERSETGHGWRLAGDDTSNGSSPFDLNFGGERAPVQG